MTPPTRSGSPAATRPGAAEADPADVRSLDTDPTAATATAGTAEDADADAGVPAATFDTGSSPRSSRLPEGHADARVAPAPDEFEPPGPVAAGRGDGGAAGDGSPAGQEPRRAAGVGGRRTRHPVLAIAVRSWRQLTSMRTALLLLFLLALAAVPGSLLPQRNINPLRVEQYFADHETLAPLLDRFSGFDVFGAPWFAAIYLLLFISLIGCLSSRIRWHARALFTAPPKAPARPGRLPGGSTWTSPLEPDVAVAAARHALRKRRFRAATARAGTRRPDGTPDYSVAAEKGYLRETGNLVFHVALVGLLAAVGLGSWFGYQGTVLVVSGNGFANTIISYDQFNGGQLVNTAKLRPFSLTLNQFQADFEPNGQPADFRADVSYATDLDAPRRNTRIRVNHPLVIGNAKVYLIGHGFAPRFVLRNAKNEVVWQSNVPCTPRDGMFTSTCTVKIPDTGLPALGDRKEPQQLAFSGVFTPTTHLDPTQGYVSTFPAARAPGLTITGFVGNLHLDEGVPQNVYTVDTRDMKQIPMTGPAGANRTAQVLALNNPDQRTLTGLPGGLRLEVDRVDEFATFQVKSDPFKREALVSAILIIAGLIASLRVRRRRVWVRARPATGGGSTIEIGGLSRSDAEGFATELAQITAGVRAATGPVDARGAGLRPRRRRDQRTQRHDRVQRHGRTQRHDRIRPHGRTQHHRTQKQRTGALMAVNEGVANLSDHLFGVCMAVYAAAMLGFAAEFAFSRLGLRRAAAGMAAATPAARRVRRPAVLVGASTVAGSGAGPAEPAGPADETAVDPADPAAAGLAAARAREIEAVRERANAAHTLAAGNDGDLEVPARARWIGRIAVILTVLGWGLHLGSVITRGIAADRVPWGNMYEFSSMICLIAVTAFLAMMTRQPIRWLGVFVMLPVVLSLGFAGTVLYVSAGPLVPALNSYWLKIHVFGAIVSSGVFLVSAVTTVLFLVKDRWESRLAEVAAGRAEATKAMRRRGGIVMRLPSSAALDTLTYRVIAFAFPIWTFAVIAGAIWAEAAWGRYWGWDPKETWSFITWVCYAAYLHARATAGWRGRRAAAISLLAFSALFVDYYLVNLVITGLHSYAGV